MARSTRILTLSVLASASLFASACDGPSGVVTDLGQVQQNPEVGVIESGGSDTVEPIAGYKQVANRNDLGSPQPRPVDQLVGEADSDVIRVQFTGQPGECTIQNASALEFDDRVEVTLLEGLHPNVAAMTCIAALENQEILLTLDAPLGSRELVSAEQSSMEPAPTDPPPPPPGDIDASSYVGLPVVEATDRAQNAGLDWRVVRDGTESFPVTMDYREDRLNFEVDDGIVTIATLG